MEGRYNTRSPAVKRLMREAQELSEPTDQYFAQPLEDNLFEWHFTVRGPADSDFQSGIYHGRIILPMDYPMKPPSIIWLTPNGRFETNKKICLSISGHHPESWQPSWSIRTALLAIIGFMPTRPGGAIGSLEYTPEERKTLAKKSQDWKCQACGAINEILLERQEGDSAPSQEARDLASQIQFEGEKPKCKDGECPITAAAMATTVTAASTTAAGPSSTRETPVTSQGQNQNQQQQQGQFVSQTPGFNMFQQWGYPAGSCGFPPTMGWPGMPGMSPQPPLGTSAVAMIPRFPLPPSQQPGGTFPLQCFPPGFATPPQGMGMFPYGPPAYPDIPQALNSAAVPHSVAATSQSTVSEDQSVLPQAAPSPPETSTDNTSPKLSNMTKTEPEIEPTATEKDGAEQENILGVNYGAGPAHSERKWKKGSGQAGKTEDVSDGVSGNVACSDTVSTTTPIKQAGDGTEQSQPNLPADKDEEEEREWEDNSDSGIAPLDLSETDQRSSYLERSVSSSVPDLEKKSKVLPKGLRQRQSATATVPTTEELEQAGPEGTGQAAAGGGVRIEAASGDTQPRLQRNPLQSPRTIAEARLARRQAVARSTQHRANADTSQYDGSFFAMVILSLATAVILLNRLIAIVDWSVLL